MIVAVDIGTSVTKAAVVERDGSTRAVAFRRSRIERYPDGRVEQSLDDVVATVADVVREVMATTTDPVEAIALTGQGDGLWLRDAAGRAVRPPISWMDARASGIVEEWTAGSSSVVERVFRLTGSAIFPGSPAALLAALDRDEPEALERAVVAGYCTDAVLQRLTGVISVDASDASMPFLDLRTRRYVDEALELCGVSRWRHLLAEPAAPGTLFALDAAGSELLGLPIGTPVSSGPYDLVACGIAAGLQNPGDGTLVVGTTLSCQVLGADPVTPPDAEPAGMWLSMPHGRDYLHVMPSMVGTAGLDWLLGLLGRDARELDTLLGEASADAGVTALPFLSPSGERAPFVAPGARGAFDGLHLGVTAADLVRAECVSLAHLARLSLETLGLTGDLAICGGGSRSDRWAQLFADVLGRPVSRPAEQELGAIGAAVVAWDALGRPVDPAALRTSRRRFEPDPARASAAEREHADFLSRLGAARAGWDSTG